MRSGANRTDSDAYQLPKEVGVRLRKLRLEVGLSQSDVAVRMCRPGPSGKSHVCQVERGYMPGPTFNSVMDFLNACGADATAIKDVIDAYTKRPPISEERTRKQVAEAAVGLPLRKQSRVEWYDRFHKPKTGTRETPEQERDRRVREARGVARAIGWERRLHRVFNDVLNELHVGASDPIAVHLMNLQSESLRRATPHAQDPAGLAGKGDDQARFVGIRARTPAANWTERPCQSRFVGTTT